MVDQIWNQFKKQGLCGSVSVRNPEYHADVPENGAPFFIKSDSARDDLRIHRALYEMDPDYTTVIVIDQTLTDDSKLKQAGFLTKELSEISFVGNDEAIQARLDEAILEGLAHKKSLIVKETGALVRFGVNASQVL